MSAQSTPEAWVSIPREADIPQTAARGNYDFGFRPAMGRLLATHRPIGKAFSALYHQIMFTPGHLTRREREMVAGVAAAAQDCFY